MSAHAKPFALTAIPQYAFLDPACLLHNGARYTPMPQVCRRRLLQLCSSSRSPPGTKLTALKRRYRKPPARALNSNRAARDAFWGVLSFCAFLPLCHRARASAQGAPLEGLGSNPAVALSLAGTWSGRIIEMVAVVTKAAVLPSHSAGPLGPFCACLFARCFCALDRRAFALWLEPMHG